MSDKPINRPCPTTSPDDDGIWNNVVRIINERLSPDERREVLNRIREISRPAEKPPGHG